MRSNGHYDNNVENTRNLTEAAGLLASYLKISAQRFRGFQGEIELMLTDRAY
jgi:hypothetical protein